MSEDLNSLKKLGWNVASIISVLFLFVLVVQGGVALFGDWFKASKTMLQETDKAQEELGNAIFLTFNAYGRLDVRSDYSVYAYLSKDSYMLVPYPDRDQAIDSIGKAWCKNKSVIPWYTLPKVVLRDIRTGEVLGSHRCIVDE